jgi:hypothetical protein
MIMKDDERAEGEEIISPSIYSQYPVLSERSRACDDLNNVLMHAAEKMNFCQTRNKYHRTTR